MLFSEWSIKRHKAHCGITQGLHNRLKRQKKHVIALSTRAAQTKRENMQPGTSAEHTRFSLANKWPGKSAGKHVAGGKSGQNSLSVQYQKITCPVTSAGKYTLQVSSARKHVTSDKRGKTSNQRKWREDM